MDYNFAEWFGNKRLALVSSMCTMEEYTITIQGMDCPGCENLVVRELSSIPGIKDADADSANGTVVIQGDQKTKERVRQTIADLGDEPGK